MIKPGEKNLLLTFDVEEFDLPADLGKPIAESLCEETAHRGLRALLSFLQRYRLISTCFVTGAIASQCPQEILSLTQIGCEVASHGPSHRPPDPHRTEAELALELGETRQALEQLTNQPVWGFRSPRFAPVPISRLTAAGFRYDSSLHPTWVPGRYNGLLDKTDVHVQQGILRIPVTVTPVIRWPLSWIWFRNTPSGLRRGLSELVFRSTKTLCIYFHSWEFVDLASLDMGLARSVTRNTGKPLETMLAGWIHRAMARGFRLTTAWNFAQRFELAAPQDGTQ